jgi:hypothetical protein
MTVSYQTEVDCPASVIFGTTPDNLDRTATGSSSSYYATYDHHVILSDLDADTTHYYQILPDGPVNSFTTPPKSSSDAGSSVSFAFFGDLGLVNGDSARAYMTTLASATPPAIDLVLHAGDVGCVVRANVRASGRTCAMKRVVCGGSGCERGEHRRRSPPAPEAGKRGSCRGGTPRTPPAAGEFAHGT